jgi:hypothetical protein
MTDQDRAHIHAKDGDFRVINRKSNPPTTTMLQYPELSKYFPGQTLQKRGEDGIWADYELPAEGSATQEENQGIDGGGTQTPGA